MPHGSRSLVLACLMAAMVIAAVGLVASASRLLVGGAVLADYYYLPLREFVPEEKHRAMEDRVIALFDASSRRMAAVTAGAFFAQVALLLVVRRLGFRESPVKAKGEPGVGADSR